MGLRVRVRVNSRRVGDIVTVNYERGMSFMLTSCFTSFLDLVTHFLSFSVVLPSEPRAASVPFVNQSSAVITWSSPAITGTQTHVLYDVECEKSCKYYGKDCEDETCDAMKKDSHAMKKEGLNVTKVIISNLPSFVNYTCKLIAKNRVSEVAERRHRVKANFTTVNLRTEGFGE